MVSMLQWVTVRLQNIVTCGSQWVSMHGFLLLKDYKSYWKNYAVETTKRKQFSSMSSIIKTIDGFDVFV